MTRWYEAGPMNGKPFFNYEAFRDYAALLRSGGDEVFNPFEADQMRWGAKFYLCGPSGDIADLEKAGYKFNIREIFAADCKRICEWAEGIAMLPGWEYSGGARAEHAIASYLRLKILYL